MRRKKLLFPSMLFWLCVLLCFSLPASAADFHVDNSGSPVCNDVPGNGSEATPWCTINYGISQISSSDTLNVKAGTYNENVFIDRPSGAAGNPTVIQAFPGHTVTILGNGVDTGRVKIANASYITFDGFIITNFNQGLFIDNSHNIIVQNITVHTVGQEGIHVRLDSSFVTIQDSTVHDTRQWQFNGEGIYIGTGSGGPLDNTNNVTIKNNEVYNVRDEAIELKPGTHDCIVEDNLIYNATTDPNWPATWGAIQVNQATAGAQDWGSNPNHIVRNNIIHSSKTAIRAGTGSTVYNNLIYSTVSPYYGIYIGNISGDNYTRTIYHNTVDVDSTRAIVVNAGTTDIKNNIGPATTNNIETSDTYYVDKAGADYHLVSGSAPINAGLNLTGIVSTDIEGNSRLTNPPPDLGAYEHVGGPRPDPPANLSLIVR